MGFSKVATGTELTYQKSSRNGQRVSKFIVHHAATTSLSAILSAFAGAREVSANYAIGQGQVVGTVDEDERAWTSASWYDGIAVTVEVANESAGGSWPVRPVDFTNLARLIADVATRHGFEINDDNILTHQELYTRFGESYPTACPGDLQRRKGELIALARSFQSGTNTEEEDMPLNPNTDYDAFSNMLQRALKYDVRPNGRGADWKLGPTFFEQINGISGNVGALSSAQAKTDAQIAALTKAVASISGGGITEAGLNEIAEAARKGAEAAVEARYKAQVSALEAQVAALKNVK